MEVGDHDARRRQPAGGVSFDVDVLLDAPDFTVDRIGVPDRARRIVQAAFFARHADLLQFQAPQMPTEIHSLNAGLTGLAFVFYRLSEGRDGTPALLAAANISAFVRTHFDALSLPAGMDVSSMPTSLFHTRAGALLVDALVEGARGHAETLRDRLDEYVAFCRQQNPRVDLTLGRGSVLIGCALLLEVLQRDYGEALMTLRQFGDEVYEDIRRSIRALRPIRKSPLVALGLAHGWTGLLYAILRYSTVVGADIHHESEFHDVVEELLAYKLEDASGLKFPSSTCAPTSAWAWTSWCNGGSGNTLFWALLSQQMGKSAYLAVAQKTAFFVCQRTRSSLAQVCCGLAGQAYAALAMYESTGDPAWLKRGSEIAELAAIRAVQSPDDSLAAALYKGEAGIALLICDLERYGSASMPVIAPLRPSRRLSAPHMSAANRSTLVAHRSQHLTSGEFTS
jgi:serine/threonine-protein kinase